MIELRSFEHEDIDRLIEWIPNSEFLLQWGGPAWRHPLDQSQLVAHLEAAGENHLIFKAVDKESGSVIGHCEIMNIDRRNRSAKIGRVLIGSQDARGAGLGKKMMQEVVRTAFEELDLHRVELLVFTFNASAIRCYEGVGFRHEGILRECRRHEDSYWSLCVMSILRHEWEKGRTS